VEEQNHAADRKPGPMYCEDVVPEPPSLWEPPQPDPEGHKDPKCSFPPARSGYVARQEDYRNQRKEKARPVSQKYEFRPLRYQNGNQQIQKEKEAQRKVPGALAR